ncbi:hypothetical protein P167DRAFT_607597 [Morchella conica CCBAS932]|uniref:Uncharacterized protein n=1 Tax=Morchella conica CCBAS932 TaxID=1392247 RepID=A0A3N4KKI9_9PEZI|nr:hypothetical protein P167DRAFT_607597 [Morchella conica CCBAS932]
MRPKAIYKPPLAPSPSSSPTPSPRPKRTRRLHRRRPPPTINWAAAHARLYTFLAQTLAGLVLGYVFFLLLCAWDHVRGGVPDRRELVCPEVRVRRVVCVEPGREDPGEVGREWGRPEKVEKVDWGRVGRVLGGDVVG